MFHLKSTFFNENGKYHLFFEFTNLKKDKAILGAMELNGDNHIHSIYEFKGHTSYPCIFRADDSVYMIPETCAERKIQFLISTEIPYKWKKMGDLAVHLSTARLLLNFAEYVNYEYYFWKRRFRYF